MSDGTGITYADATWNPVTGCTPISEGCAHCYAETMARRLQAMGAKGYERGFEVTLHPERLKEPAHWRKPRRIFVCSMSDLFHDDVPGDFINRVWLSAYNAPQHTYLFLTKRPKNIPVFFGMEIPSAWVGVTVENQPRAGKRIPDLLDTSVAHPWVSLEPLLGPVDLRPWLEHLRWVVCGGESGPGYRPMNLDWVRDIRDQCSEANVPFHFKQAAGMRPAKCPPLDGVVYGAAPPFGART